MKDRKIADQTLGQKALGLISGLFSKPSNAPEKIPPHGDDARAVASSFGSRRHEIKRTESSAELYRTLSSELMTSDIAAANLQVLGLNALRKKVGDQWQKHRKVIQTVIEGTLSKALTSEDRFWCLDDELYVIAFKDTDVASTIRRTEAIGAAIVKQLVGIESGSLVSVRALSGMLTRTADGSIEFAEKTKAKKNNTRAEPLRDQPDGLSGEVAFSSWAKTLRSDESTRELDDLLREAEDIHKQRLETSSLKKEHDVVGIDEALTEAHATRDQRSFLDYSLGFLPTWDAKKKAITAYAVVPYFRGQNRWYFEHDVLNEDASLQDILDLDIACLRTSIRETAKSFTANKAVLTFSQIHYLTLTSKPALAEVLRECNRIPEFLRKYLAVEVVHMPAELPSHALIDAVAMIRRYFRIFAVRAGASVPLVQIKSSGFDMLTFEHYSAELSSDDKIRYQKILNEARTLSLPVVAIHVPSKETVTQLAEIGVSYVAGLAIGMPMESPQGLLWRDLSGLPIEMPGAGSSQNSALETTPGE